MPTRPDATSDLKSPERRLLLFTSLSSVDGTITVMAAAGALGDPMTAVGAGLFLIAGVGAWLSARDAYASQAVPRRWYRVAVVGLISGGLAIAAAALGSVVSPLEELVWLTRAAGVATISLGLDVAGIRLRIGGARVALLAVLAGFGLEVFAHWSP